MARRRLEGLERVLGVNALFSTAYGNVGSSIYYALGLVASYALGLTPVVFIITGFFFFCTAATYAEATAMFPEAGGSSSFARRAFNEFWSFFAAWAGMLTYTVTIAISAFFVPHYIGGVFEFADALRTSPGDIIAAAVVIGILAAVNVFGAKESTGINVTLAVIDFLTQLLLVVLGAFLVLSPDQLAENVHLGVAPKWSDFVLAIPIGMLAYTGIETVSNMAEEAKDEIHTIPAAINRVRIAVFAIYFTLPAVALSALPVTQSANGEYNTKLGLTEEEGGFAGDPVLGVVKQLDLGIFQHAPRSTSACSPPRSCSSPPTRASSASRGSSTRWASTARCPTRCGSLHPKFRTPWIGITVFSLAAIVLILPGQEDLLGSVYSFGALLSFTMAHAAVARLRAKRPDIARPYRGPGNVRIGELRRAAVRARRRRVHRDRVRRDRRAQPQGGGDRRRLAARRHRRLRDLPPPPGARPDLHPQGRDRPAGRRPRGGVRLRARPRRRRHYDEQIVATAVKLAARKRRGIHVLVTITVPNALEIDAAMPDAEAAAELDHRAGQAAGRRPRLRALGEGPRRPGRPADHRGGAGHARGGGRARAAAARLRPLRVRQDARDRARRAAVPRDHRVAAAAEAGQRRAPRARAGDGA